MRRSVLRQTADSSTMPSIPARQRCTNTLHPAPTSRGRSFASPYSGCTNSSLILIVLNKVGKGLTHAEVRILTTFFLRAVQSIQRSDARKSGFILSRTCWHCCPRETGPHLAFCSNATANMHCIFEARICCLKFND